MYIYLLTFGFVLGMACGGALAVWAGDVTGEWVSAMENKFKPQSGVVEI